MAARQETQFLAHRILVSVRVVLGRVAARCSSDASFGQHTYLMQEMRDQGLL
jgi:hypothetical protein